jgi:hypothetical protein
MIRQLRRTIDPIAKKHEKASREPFYLDGV